MLVQTVNLDDCLPLINQGHRGLEVSLLQRCLVFYGYLPDNSINGIFDFSTDKAVRNFQHDHGLYCDGVVNLDTWKALADTLN